MDASTRGKREKILDTALSLLTELGYEKLTQPRVAKAAGITQGHLTYYFPTRSDLLLAVAEHSLRISMEQVIDKQGRLNANPEMVTATVRNALLDKPRTRTILGLVIASDSDREIKKPLREMIVHARGIAAALLESLNVDPTPERAALLHACLVGCSVIAFALDNPKSDREMGEAATELLRLMASGSKSKQPSDRRGTARNRKKE